MPENVTTPDSRTTFEEDLGALQKIVLELEGGALGLDESLEKFEQGIRILKRCNATLERAEKKVELLVAVSDAGVAETIPFDAAATFDSGATPAKKKPRRKGASGGGGSVEPEASKTDENKAESGSERPSTGTQTAEQNPTGVFPRLEPAEPHSAESGTSASVTERESSQRATKSPDGPRLFE